MSDLWMEASRDIEADDAQVVMTQAKMAAASIWPFLAQAGTEREFEHRLALAEGRIDLAVPDAVARDHVVTAFREDFKIYRSLEDSWDTGTAKTAAVATEDQPLRIFHEASGTWITAEGAAAPGPANAWNQQGQPEAGPATGETGQFPQHPTGADPVDPINEQYPATPSPWTENGIWVDRPMQFNPPRTGAAYQNEGVQTGPGPNPDFFAGGGEGVAGDQQGGFPVDESLPEPNTQGDFYGSVPPVQSGGSTGGDVSYSNGKTAEKDNHGACFDCNQPVYRNGSNWMHLTGDDKHPVRLSQNHPYVKARQSKKAAAPRPGMFFDPVDKSVAMARTADVSSSDMGPGNGSGSGGGGTPDMPPSMVSGGPGAQAMPMTIPNESVSANPFSNNSGGGGGGGAPAGPSQMPPTMGRFVPRVAEVRDRPTADNPNGVRDEYDLHNWDKALEQTPRQAPEDRGVNTPQQPGQPINQVSSETMGAEDDEEGRR